MSRQKQPQVLTIEPANELRFKGPFDEVVTSELKLTNPSHQRVCFKVKTTAPKRYCVRPNSGFVDPGATVKVSVMLQPMETEVPDKAKHKFMVQSMLAASGGDDVEKLWAEASPSDLMDSKLRCVFQEQDSDVQQEDSNSGEHNTENAPAVPVVAAADVVVPKPQQNNGSKAELQSIMEECKRLQSENAKIKQLNDEFRSKASSARPNNSDIIAQQKRQFTLFIIAAFVLGLLAGYILL